MRKLITVFFFFSSRRRHTRSLRDWSSDVCSSDLPWSAIGVVRQTGSTNADLLDLASRGKIGRASCRERGVDLGGRRTIKKKNKKKQLTKSEHINRNRNKYRMRDCRVVG